MGRIPWIKPYTDEILSRLYEKGVRKLMVVCPSFVADCLETLEEVGIFLKNKWLEMGGEQFILLPSLNANKTWVGNTAKWLTARHAGERL